MSFVSSALRTSAQSTCYVEAIVQMWFERFRHNIFNVYRNDKIVEYVCSLHTRTMDNMDRCIRNVVLTTSFKNSQSFTTLFSKMFYVFETIRKYTRVVVCHRYYTSKCQWGVCGTFFSTFAFAIKFRFVTIVARTILAIWIATTITVHFSS